MSEIYFIRHGQASIEGEQYDQLSDLGRTQSQILGDYLANMEIKFDAAYAGTLNRQKDTASEVLARMPGHAYDDITIMPGLNEYDSESIINSQLPAMVEKDPPLAQDAERMAERRAFQRVFEPAMLRWSSGNYDVDGVETWRDFSGRVHRAVDQIMAENGRKKTVAVFTSGGPISATVQMAIGITADVAVQLNWQIQNSSVTEFKYNDSGIFLSSFNSVHHLQALKNRDLLTYR